MMAMSTSTIDTVAAERAKAEANAFFKAGKWVDAERLYSTNLKLENNGHAIRDADEAIKLDQACIKAYYRRASANIALSRFKDALRDLRTVVKYAPNDVDAKAKLNEVDKTVRRVEFERALAFDEPSVVDRINIADMAVPSDYDGERWDDDSSITDMFIQDLMERFRNQKSVHSKYAYKIMLTAKRLFDAAPPLVDVRIPARFTVCGDVHGQYYDLLSIFEKNGMPSADHGYLFNGDFVDRGSFSAEVILLLLAFKCRFPETFHMTRGNHETTSMNQVYGFEGEIKSKYSDLMFKLFTELPLAFVIEQRIFVTHGGLFSRDGVTLDEIRQIDRFKQPPNEGLMCELLWSDPQPQPGRGISKRGVGLQFGPDVTEDFCRTNNLDMVVRSHEVKDGGYAVDHDGRCVTVFSAPNYCDQAGNKGAFINLRKKDVTDLSNRPELHIDYVTFDAVPHPSVKPMRYAGGYGGMMGF